MRSSGSVKAAMNSRASGFTLVELMVAVAIMAIIAAEGDINPLKASGRKYYRIGDDGEVNL